MPNQKVPSAFENDYAGLDNLGRSILGGWSGIEQVIASDNAQGWHADLLERRTQPGRAAVDIDLLESHRKRLDTANPPQDALLISM